MRLSDRAIREELCRQTMSVPIPDDLWANISRELDKDTAKARPALRFRASSRGVHLRQMLAIGAVAGIFWMMLIPSGAHVDRVQQPAPSPAAAPPAAAVTEAIPWDIPSEERIKEQPSKDGKGGTERQPSAPADIMIY